MGSKYCLDEITCRQEKWFSQRSIHSFYMFNELRAYLFWLLSIVLIFYGFNFDKCLNSPWINFAWKQSSSNKVKVLENSAEGNINLFTLEYTKIHGWTKRFLTRGLWNQVDKFPYMYLTSKSAKLSGRKIYYLSRGKI